MNDFSMAKHDPNSNTGNMTKTVRDEGGIVVDQRDWGSMDEDDGNGMTPKETVVWGHTGDHFQP